MKICIFGAGAIGGYLGAMLARAGADPLLIARGPHLEAMRRDGLTLIEEGGDGFSVRPRCTDELHQAETQDYVIVTLKAHTVPGALPALYPLLGPDTAVVTAMNGIPYWYFHGFGGPYRDHRLETVDPGGALWNGLGPERAIGCVVFAAGEVISPGAVRHEAGNTFQLGEPDGADSARCRALSALLIDAGLNAPVRPKIRDDIWLKFWGNMSFNPVSALTHGSLLDIASDPGTHDVVAAMMAEARGVGEALGVSFPLDIDARIEIAAAVGHHKTSMLQDLERGRPMEIDPMVAVVAEMGRLVGRPTPTVDMILALVRQRARLAGCYS